MVDDSPASGRSGGPLRLRFVRLKWSAKKLQQAQLFRVPLPWRNVKGAASCSRRGGDRCVCSDEDWGVLCALHILLSHDACNADAIASLNPCWGAETLRRGTFPAHLCPQSQGQNRFLWTSAIHLLEERGIAGSRRLHSVLICVDPSCLSLLLALRGISHRAEGLPGRSMLPSLVACNAALSACALRWRWAVQVLESLSLGLSMGL